MELRILSSLNFGLNRPLPLHFLRRYSKAGDVDIIHHTLAKYMIELCQMEYDMVHYPPSLIAAASLYLAILILNSDADIEESWTRTLQYYSTYSSTKLLPIVGKMATILKRAGKGKHKAVYNKYQTGKYMRIADIEELKGARLAELAE